MKGNMKKKFSPRVESLEGRQLLSSMVQEHYDDGIADATVTLSGSSLTSGPGITTDTFGAAAVGSPFTVSVTGASAYPKFAFQFIDARKGMPGDGSGVVSADPNQTFYNLFYGSYAPLQNTGPTTATSVSGYFDGAAGDDVTFNAIGISASGAWTTLASFDVAKVAPQVTMNAKIDNAGFRFGAWQVGHVTNGVSVPDKIPIAWNNPNFQAALAGTYTGNNIYGVGYTTAGPWGNMFSASVNNNTPFAFDSFIAQTISATFSEVLVNPTVNTKSLVSFDTGMSQWLDEYYNASGPVSYAGKGGAEAINPGETLSIPGPRSSSKGLAPGGLDWDNPSSVVTAGLGSSYLASVSYYGLFYTNVMVKAPGGLPVVIATSHWTEDVSETNDAVVANPTAQTYTNPNNWTGYAKATSQDPFYGTFLPTWEDQSIAALKAVNANAVIAPLNPNLPIGVNAALPQTNFAVEALWGSKKHRHGELS